MHTALANVDHAIRAWLELELRMLEARHTMARPGSRGFREAYAAAPAVAAPPRPDVAGALSTLGRAIGDARATELADWPPAARGALVELLPLLDQYLRQMILPPDPGPPGASRPYESRVDADPTNVG